MTDLEMTRLCAEARGWSAYKEKRGDYELCVAIPHGSPKPWERSRNSEAQRARYTECTLEEAQRIGFFGIGLPNPLHDDAQAMALDSVLIDEKHSISFHKTYFCRHEYPSGVIVFEYHADMGDPANRRRARVECVAKMQESKHG